MRGNRFMQGLGERVGIAGLVLFTAAPALGAAGCDKVTGHPAPRPPHSEDAPDPDYQCGYDGNQLCPSTPPPVRASCDEPAAWCGGVGEAVQR